MKHLTKSFIAAALCCLMCGCSAADKSSESNIPVLSIVTADGKTDFATKPVAEHVSAQIATWTPNYVMPPAPYYEKCKITLTDENDTVLLDSVEAQVKVRGNWTTNYDKKPLRIKFDEKQSLLGLNEGASFKNWVLLAEYKDASMLRNKSAFQIAGEILGKDGLYASDAEFVEVNINDEYWGVYLLAEYQQINENRVNITEAEDDYTGTDIGYLLEFDGNYLNEDPLQQFYVDYHNNAALTPFDGNEGSGKTIRCLPLLKSDPKKEVGFTIKSDIYSQEQHDFIASYVNNIYYIMYEAAYYDKAFVFNEDCSEIAETTEITAQEAVERVVDVDSLADMYIISELTCDADLYWSSFFMTVDCGENGNRKLTFQAPWDFDSAMGNKSRCPDGTGYYASNIIPDVNGTEYETINPWLAVLMYEDWYQDIIRDKWTAEYDGGTFERAYEMIASDKERMSGAFSRNNDRWGISTKDDSVMGELSENAKKCETADEAADYLESWLKSRVEFMNGCWHR